MRRSAFTIVELVLVIVILGIIAGMGVSFFAPIMNLYFQAPTQLRTEYIANRILDTVIEGDSTAKGLRSLSSIESASSTSITYRDADYATNNKKTTISWDIVTGQFTRTITAGATTIQKLPPDTPNTDIKINGINPGVIFTYLATGEAAWTSGIAHDIGRVAMSWEAYTGTGNINAAQGKYRVHSGVIVKQF